MAKLKPWRTKAGFNPVSDLTAAKKLKVQSRTYCTVVLTVCTDSLAITKLAGANYCRCSIVDGYDCPLWSISDRSSTFFPKFRAVVASFSL